MASIAVIIDLLGEIALLLWAVRMVTAGVQTAFGGTLRQWLGQGRNNRLKALLIGIGVTALLQSSTATALMMGSLASSGLIDLTPALAVMLGANIGTAIVVQLVSYSIGALFPVLMFAGVIAVGRNRRAIVRDVGRAVIGLALMLLALHMLVDTMQPLEASDSLRLIMQILTVDPLVTVLLAALLSWASHSSVAIVIFVMSLTATGVVSPEAAFRMVIGANLGAAINPVLAEWGGNPAEMRLPLGNVINRIIGALVALPLVGPAVQLLNHFGEPWARLPADFHVLFNLGTAAVFYAFLPAQARLLNWLLPSRAAQEGPGTAKYLDAASLSDAPVAIANAAREMMRMADVVDTMLVASQLAFHENDRDKITAVSRQDDVLDQLNDAIQRYLAAISSDSLAAEETQRIGEILSFAINLEHVGDIIDKNLMELAAKRIRLQIVFSAEILAEIDNMHARLRENLKLALTVFMFADEDAARRLVAEKEGFREFEQTTRDRHLQLIGSGKTYGLEMNALQLDVTRDLKRIAAHIATNAHGLLARSGQLRDTRLRSR
eukprot:gene19670-20130_t